MEQNFSFLLGAGFSVPHGYPTVKELDTKLMYIKSSDIYIHTSQNAGFLNGSEDPNPYILKEQRHFVEDFLKFYNEKILKPGETFHFESFIDFYTGLMRGEKCELYDNFFKQYRKKYKASNLSKIDEIMKFHSTFIQLVWKELHKTYEKVHLAKPYNPNYNVFLHLLEYLSNDFTIHIHTLNLDLLMEYLSFSDSVGGNLDDGFEEIGSPYYAKHYEYGYMIRLRYFSNKYDQNFRLYKLHGSVDHIPFNFNKEFTVVKSVRGIGMTDFYKEFRNQQGEFEYYNCSWNSYPDFLCGTTEKIKRYNDSYYYQKVFEHFKNNLLSSSYLIVIGYGFGDPEINKMIKDKFLSAPGKKMLVINPTKPSSELLDLPNVIHLPLGVEYFLLTDVENALGINLTRKEAEDKGVTQNKVICYE
ncbi:MAG: hypothetical protein EHM58_12300 [Ignavibacteriae bacterium]|nr:MAG: hypothetical protein EHM58_12300 [Ignavibacteriota bacterium]